MLNLLLILLFVLLVFLISYFVKNENLDINESNNEMIRCSICNTYVEASTAKKKNEKWICSRSKCN
ncbi:MAG: hypothetical protein CBD82_01315 [Gammaproteobacteria bacterium TMED222]|nr:MAG: hypothetical protein CBD82_01315 [Gammaproteobacteria bacterium TMED222]